MPIRRVAAFDLGSNTTLAAVVERDGEGGLAVLGDRAIITGLGRGATPALAPEAVARVLSAIEELAIWARELGAERLAGVGTSALRDAPNRDALLVPARAHLDDVRAISGADEARLTFAGALVGIPAPHPAERTVVDIGGGSTEIVRGTDAGILHAVSLDVGAVRLTERWLRHDPPLPSELAALDADVRRALVRAADSLRGPLYFLAGTATNVAACVLGVDASDLGRIVGTPLRVSAVRAAADRIRRTPIRHRLALGGIERGREATIAAGASIFAIVAETSGADEIVVGDGGVRFGLAAEALDALAVEG